MKILLMGLDPDDADRVSFAAQVRWPDATTLVVHDDVAGLQVLKEEIPDLVVVQIPLGKNSVKDFIRRIRGACSSPLIALASKVGLDSMQEVQALEAGADDYFRADTDLIRLAARIVALVRRAQGHKSLLNNGLLSGGPLLLNPATYDVFVDGLPLKLTKTEFQLLHLLMKHEGSVVTHQFVESAIWGPSGDSTASLKKYIQRLRTKLGDDGSSPRFIVSVYGVGYQFVGSGLDPRTQWQPSPWGAQAVAG